jgi:hypothetical protein
MNDTAVGCGDTSMNNRNYTGKYDSPISMDKTHNNEAATRWHNNNYENDDGSISFVSARAVTPTDQHHHYTGCSPNLMQYIYNEFI